MIKNISTKTHERLINFRDDKVGLCGYIVIHNTNLGPATGGTRFKVYENYNSAIQDALNLSRAMTYKCALAGVNYGGGKSVIIANGVKKNREFLEAYARIIDSFDGKFTTGKDVGIGDEDIAHMSRVTPYINGHTGSEDPSIYAAIGVFIALRATMKKVCGSSDLAGKRVAIKGLGQVGFELARLSYDAGAKLVLADIDATKTELAKKSFKGAKIVSPTDIHKTRCDIYAPCALGAEFDERNIHELNCRMICGAANNQLTNYRVGAEIMSRDIVYIPDYIANAGGLIAVVDGFDHKRFSDARVRKNLLVIKDNVDRVIGLSIKQKKPTQELADELAENIIYGRG